jgi:hypothetical protein
MPEPGRRKQQRAAPELSGVHGWRIEQFSDVEIPPLDRRIDLAKSRAKDRVNDPEMLRLFLEGEASAFGYTLEELLATIKRGRISEKNRPRYDMLASIVASLRHRRLMPRDRRRMMFVLELWDHFDGDDGTRPLETPNPTLESIGAALGGLTREQVRILEQRGVEVMARGCRRHERFREACEHCLEVTYRVPRSAHE